MTDETTTTEASTATALPAFAPAPSAFSKRELTIGGVCGGLGLVVGIVGSLLVASVAGGIGSLIPSSAMADATQACEVEADPFIELGDKGQSLSMQTEGEKSPGADVADVVCVLGELDVPDSVLTRMSSTRALDGRQSADWNDLSASWGYHPDNGLDIVIELSNQ